MNQSETTRNRSGIIYESCRINQKTSSFLGTFILAHDCFIDLFTPPKQFDNFTTIYVFTYFMGIKVVQSVSSLQNSMFISHYFHRWVYVHCHKCARTQICTLKTSKAPSICILMSFDRFWLIPGLGMVCAWCAFMYYNLRKNAPTNS